MTDCLKLVDFERYARNEMDDAESTRVRTHLTACPVCEAALQDFLADDRLIASLRDNALQAIGPPESPGRLLGAEAPDTIYLTSADTAMAATLERLPQVEGFEIRRTIGRGGMGIVYEALQKKLNRLVALKLLPAVVGSAHPQLVARFRREAAAAASLHHTHIIPIYDFGESPDGYYYAMELIDGISLAAAVRRFGNMNLPLDSTAALATVFTTTESAECDTKEPAATRIQRDASSAAGKGRFYFRQVARWVAEAADALEYAHQHGLIHRDIKPSNLMLARDDRILILDFGLVKAVDERSVTATGSLMGTYRYMSPEQVGAKRIAVDRRTDVYSLGATMYELLTFRPAFNGTTESEVLSLILFKDPIPPRKIVPAVPVDLQTICLKAMEKSPGARYQSAKDMADDLRRYLGDASIIARRPGVARRAAKSIRRHPALAISALAIVAVLCLALTAFALQRQQSVAADVKRLHATAGALRDREDFTGAENAYQQILRLDPSDYHGLVSLASLYTDQFSITAAPELFERADALLSRAIAVSPPRDVCFAWNTRGVLLGWAHRLPAAIDAFQQAIRANQDYYASWVGLGTAYALDERASDAEVALETAAALAKLDRARTAPEHWRTLLRWHLMPLQRLAAVQIYLRRPAAAQTVEQSLSLAEHTNAATLVIAAMYQLSLGPAGDAALAQNYAQTACTLAANNQTTRPEGRETLRRAKRTLALAKLRNGQSSEASAIAAQAESLGDEPVYARLIAAVSAANAADGAAAEQALAAAESFWPEALRTAEYSAIDDGFSLWIDSRTDLAQLQAAAREVLSATPTPP